jgi:AbrB family looped-hinge helix DNA binding protein
MPIVKVNQHFQVTIPVTVRERLGIARGDFLEAVVHEDAVIFKPKVLFDRKSVESSLINKAAEEHGGK